MSSKVLLQKFLQRELIAISYDVQKAAFDDSLPVDDLIDTAEEKVFTLAQRNVRNETKPITSVINRAIEQIETNQKREDGLSGIPSGYTGIDKVTFGDALPEGEAQRFEDGWIADIEYYYEYYNYMSAIYYGSAYFADLDEAGRDYTGLGPDGDWRAFLHEYAEKLVKQYLVLNMVARLSAITISEEDAKQWVRDQAEKNGVDVATVLGRYSIEDVYSMIAIETAQRILLTVVEFDYGELPIAAEAAE